MTRRPLPTEDALLDALPQAEREALARVWRHRAAMERRVGDAFEVIAGALRRRGAPQALVDLADRAVDDEMRHTELSMAVAARFAGRELDPPARLELVVPTHAGASAELKDALFVVGQCVLNETTASAFLEACLQRAKGAVAKSALSELLSDEIDHGRIGWAFLASLDASSRAEIAPWLLPMAYTNLKQWRHESPEDPAHRASFEDHGAPAASVIHEALVEALRSLILPGLRELQMDTGPLEAWLEAGASTEKPPIALLRD